MIFSAWRIFDLSSLDQLASLWEEGPQVYTKSMILSVLAYGFLASTYIAFTGRKPIGLRSPYPIDEKSELSRSEKIRKGISLTCGGLFILYILYLFIYVIPNSA